MDSQFDISPQGLQEPELIEDPLDILHIEQLAKQQNEAESDQQIQTPRLDEISNITSQAPSQHLTQFISPEPRHIYPQSEITPVIVIQPPPPMFFPTNQQPPMTPKLFYPEQQFIYPPTPLPKYNTLTPQYFNIPHNYQSSVPQTQLTHPQYNQTAFFNPITQISPNNPQKIIQNPQRIIPAPYFAQNHQSNLPKQPEPILPNSNIPFTTSQIMINPQPNILRSPDQSKPPSVIKNLTYNQQKFDPSPSYARPKMETYHSQMITSRPQFVTHYSNIQPVNLRLSQRLEQPNYIINPQQFQVLINGATKFQSNIKPFQGIQQPTVFPSPQVSYNIQQIFIIKKTMSLVKPVQPQIMPTQHYNSTIRTLFR